MDALERDFAELFGTSCEAAGVIGASAVVAFSGERAAAQFGSATCDPGRLVDESTRFRTGSTTKPLTASVLVDLLADARIALDAPVTSVVKEFAPTEADELTFRDLLLHQDGLDGVFWDGFGDGDEAISAYASACSELPRVFSPGTSWGYSNSAYVLAGRAIELLAGQTYDHAVERLLCQPAGCTATSLFEARPPALGANGHYGTSEAPRCADVPTGQRALAPAGATTWSTPRDLVTLAEYLLAPSKVPDLLAHAVELPPGERDAATHQTLGWKVFRWGPTDCFGHDGGSTGQATFLRWVPDAAAGIALTANTTPNAMFLWATVSQWFYDQVGIAVPGSREPEPDAMLDPADLGTYESAHVTFELSATADGPEISVRTFGANAPSTAAATAIGPNLYRSRPLVDAYGIFSTEITGTGLRLLHAGPFTARHRVAG